MFTSANVKEVGVGQENNVFLPESMDSIVAFKREDSATGGWSSAGCFLFRPRFFPTYRGASSQIVTFSGLGS